MSSFVITLTKQEIEQAVLDYVNHRVTVHGRKLLDNPSVFFNNSDVILSYFECNVEVNDAASASHPNSEMEK